MNLSLDLSSLIGPPFINNFTNGIIYDNGGSGGGENLKVIILIIKLSSLSICFI